MKHFRNTLLISAMILAFAFVSASPVFAAEPNQVNCPVMGAPINKAVYTDYEGKRIYFCCPACIGAFEKSPEKFMEKFEKEGIVLEDAPAAKKE